MPDSSSMDCQNCILRVQRHFLRNFFHRITLNVTMSQKIQLVLSKLHSTFPGNFWAKQFSKLSFWYFFEFLPDSSSMGCQNCILRLQRHFLRNFRHRIIINGTVSGKIQLVLSELHSTFPGNIWAKQFSFTSPCQILQAWVAKTVFYVSRGTFWGIFLTES